MPRRPAGAGPAGPGMLAHDRLPDSRLASIPGAVIELSPAAAAADAAGGDLGRCLAVPCRATGGPQPARCAELPELCKGPAGHNRFAVGTVRIPLEVSGRAGSGRLVEAEGFGLVSAAAGATESSLASSSGIEVRRISPRLTLRTYQEGC